MSLNKEQIKINLDTFISSYMISKKLVYVQLMLPLIKKVMKDSNEFIISDTKVLKKDPNISSITVDIIVDKMYLMSVIIEQIIKYHTKNI